MDLLDAFPRHRAGLGDYSKTRFTLTMTSGERDFRVQDLSRAAQDALQKALAGRDLSLESLRSLDQRDIRNIPGVGRKTSDEIATWAFRHGVSMPDSFFS
jgi:hypothetical protein